MPTGWRPADVAARFPVEVVSDFGSFQKYETHPGKSLQVWSWIQFFFTLGLMLFLFNQFGRIAFPEALIYGAFLFVSVYSFTTLLDKSSWALATECLRAVFGLGLIYWMNGSWFVMDQVFPQGTYLIAAYLILSVFVVAYFVGQERHAPGRMVA